MDYKELSDIFLKLDRRLFIDNDMKRYAAWDTPLPIGFGQTISQPSLVLEMTYLLAPEKESKVLEIGTGTGFQTALLAEFSAAVYTIERIPELADRAKKRLTSLGYANINFKIGDGSAGWPDFAPYDRILVTAAAGKPPTALIDQLARSGRMVVPVGPQNVQQLQLITKDEEEKIEIKNVGMVAFVEMKGKYGWDKD